MQAGQGDAVVRPARGAGTIVAIEERTSQVQPARYYAISMLDREEIGFLAMAGAATCQIGLELAELEDRTHLKELRPDPGGEWRLATASRGWRHRRQS